MEKGTSKKSKTKGNPKKDCRNQNKLPDRLNGTKTNVPLGYLGA